MTQSIKSYQYTHSQQNHDIVDDILSDENDDLSLDEQIAFFQRLINSGEAWHSQGSYGRQAMRLIEEGYCVLGEQGYTDAYGNSVPSRHQVKAGTKGSIAYCQKLHPERKIAA